MGVMGGTVLGVFVGLIVNGAVTYQNAPLMRTVVVCAVGGGVLAWLWEWWHAREARRLADRLKKARRRDAGDADGAELDG